MWKKELSDTIKEIGLAVFVGSLEFKKGPLICLIGQNDAVDYFSERSGETHSSVQELYAAIEYEHRNGSSACLEQYVRNPENLIGVAFGDDPVKVIEEAFTDWGQKVGVGQPRELDCGFKETIRFP